MNKSTHAADTEVQVPSGEHLAFRLGTQEYGLAISGIQEIRSYEPPTRIAGSPAHVLGVLDLRGESVPLIDMRVCLGLDASFTASTVTVVVNLDHETIGVVVDSVSDVVDLMIDQIRDVPSTVGKEESHSVVAIAQIDHDRASRTLLLLDAEQLTSRVRKGAILDVEACS